MSQDNPLLQRILTGYGIKNASILAPQKGYRNQSFPIIDDGRQLNLILYKSEPGMLERIKRANRVADFVAQSGYPARKTHSKRIAQLKSENLLKYAALYEYLPGHTIPWDGYTQDHIKLLGKTMSDMHAVLLQLPADDLPSVSDEYLDIVHRMRTYFTNGAVQRAMADKVLLRIVPEIFDEMEQLLTGTAILPGKQALHMDFVRSNILFQEAASGDEFKVRISGILDFEKAAYGHPLFDIARTLAFLLVDCKHKEATKVRKYFLGSGYIKRGAGVLSDKHMSLLEPLINLFLLYDLYKFMRHNPYESLPDNEHFIRTVGLLIPKHLVVPTTSIAE